MKKRVNKKVNKKTKPSEEFMQLILDKSKAVLRKDDLSNFEIELDKKLDKKFNDQKTEITTEIISKVKNMFDGFTTSLLNGMDSTMKDAVKTFGDENVDIKNRVSVLETKIKVLESK